MIRIGVLTPHVVIGPEAEFPEMAPGRLATRVERVTSGRKASGDVGPVSATALRAATDPPLLERAARRLVADGVDVIGYASTTSAYVIGFDAESAIVSTLSQLTGLPVVSGCAAAVLALRLLEVDRVALIGAPWFSPETNEAATDYFREQEIEVVSSVSAKLSLDPERIDPNPVYEWVSHHVGDSAQAVFIGGNGFRTVGAIERLEATLGRPVLTANQVLLWKLLADAGNPFRVDGFGQLFSHSSGT
jgi:maleate isomerase